MTHSENEANFGSTSFVLKNLFRRLAPEDMQRLRQVATRRQYPTGTVLCHQDADEKIFYVLVRGIVTITRHLTNTQEHVIGYRRAGEFFGEMALIDNSPRSASVTAATDVEVLEIDDETFAQVLKDSPELALTLLHHSQTELRNSMRREIGELLQKNEELSRAYANLQAAQAELVLRERTQRDLELAAHVQRGLLPKAFPRVAGMTFAARALPAREIGGDFYDAFRLDEEHVGLLIADVSDKSIHAAIYMAIARALFHTEVRRTLSPREVVLSVHQLLLDVSSEDDMFVTVFYGVFHPGTRHLTYVRAGHDRPLVLHSDGTLEQLPGAGRFIGMFEELEIEERSFELCCGDRLIMLSDGVTDARNAADEEYGSARLAEVVQSCVAVEPERMVGAILEDVLAFQGDAPQFDDITLLVTAIE
jgi:serine phosphatase RsbU (regulator of sigma subunit)